MGVRQKTVYVASDGKEFDDERKAEAYESDILYAGYRKAEGDLEKVFSDTNVVLGIWEQRRLVQAYIEARERYERY